MPLLGFCCLTFLSSLLLARAAPILVLKAPPRSSSSSSLSLGSSGSSSGGGGGDDGSSSHVRRSLSIIEPEKGDLCLTVEPPYMGGLSNSLAFLNEAITFASGRSYKMRTVFPNLEVDGHGYKHEEMFDNFLSATGASFHPRVDALVDEGLSVWSSTTTGSGAGGGGGKRGLECNLGRIDKKDLESYKEDWNPMWKPKSHRCPLDFMTWTDGSHSSGFLGDDAAFEQAARRSAQSGKIYSAPAGDKARQLFDGCALLIALPGKKVHFHHNYRFSQDVVRSLYFTKYPNMIPSTSVQELLGWTTPGSGPGTPRPPPRRLVAGFHFRLGDVFANVEKHLHQKGHSSGEHTHKDSGKWIKKLMSPMWIPFGLFLLQKAVPDMQCIDFHLYTDVGEDHSAIREIEQSLSEHNLPSVRVHGDEVSSRLAIDSMVFSDFLSVGTSGFGRVAAVLNTGVSIAPDAIGHPLAEIKGVIEIEGMEARMLWDELGVTTFEQAKALALGNELRSVTRARERLRRDLEGYIRAQRPELIGPCGFDSQQKQSSAVATGDDAPGAGVRKSHSHAPPPPPVRPEIISQAKAVKQQLLTEGAEVTDDDLTTEEPNDAEEIDDDKGQNGAALSAQQASKATQHGSARRGEAISTRNGQTNGGGSGNNRSLFGMAAIVLMAAIAVCMVQRHH